MHAGREEVEETRRRGQSDLTRRLPVVVEGWRAEYEVIGLRAAARVLGREEEAREARLSRDGTET